LFIVVVGAASAAGCHEDPPAVVDPPPDAGAGVDAPPCVSSVFPSRGAIGTQLTLTGLFGDAPASVEFSGVAGEPAVQAEIVSWSPYQVVVTVPVLPYTRWSIAAPRTCAPVEPPTFQVIPPVRVYIDNNTNNADGVDTITTMAYDGATGALTPMGPPTPIGIPASHRAGCSDSLLLVSGPRPRLYVSGDTGVAALDIDLATGLPRPSAIGPTFPSGATGGAELLRRGAYFWAATDDGIVNWRLGANAEPIDPVKLSSSAVRSLTVFGTRPSELYATRSDGRFDAFTVAYPRTADGSVPTPVVTAMNGSPFGVPVASTASAGLTLVTRRNADSLLYAPGPDGLGVWKVDSGARTATEITGSPFALTPPSGALGRPIFITTLDGPALFQPAMGSGYILAAKVSPIGAPSQVAGSPWNFAPDVTNLSCAQLITVASSSRPTRLIAADAGNRRIAVLDISIDLTRPVPVAGSPFTMTDTPSELASGIAVLAESPVPLP
jgi:hypothetical protein